MRCVDKLGKSYIIRQFTTDMVYGHLFKDISLPKGLSFCYASYIKGPQDFILRHLTVTSSLSDRADNLVNIGD